jgi:acyl-CoA-binding protein
LTSDGDADITFIKADEAERFDLQLQSGSTVVVMPGSGEQMNTIIDMAGGVVPKETNLPILFYATQKWGQHYVMLDDGATPDPLAPKKEKVLFYELRIIPLVHWLNNVEDYKKSKKASANMSDDPYNYDELLANIEDDGLYMTYNFPFSQNFHVDWDDGYDLNASSSIDIGLRVYPLYKQSCHGDKSGDYYMVTTEITPYNQNLWHPYSDDCGLFNIDTFHMIGYWFNYMHTAIKLVDKDGNEPSGITYNTSPIPENAIDSHQYAQGTSTTIGGSATGGFVPGGPTGSLCLSFSHTVSSTVSYSMDDIEYTLNSATREVCYDYESKNVNPRDDTDYDTYWPKNCRTQWTVRQAWVWFVPRGESGVDDNSDAAFQILINGNMKISSYWYVWHWSGDFGGYQDDFTPLTIKNQAWQLPAPHRNSWGLTSIKSEYTDAVMTNIRYYKTGEEDKDPVATDNMSYHQNDFALMGLSDGKDHNQTYTIIYETKDPNTGEHKNSWKFENVEIKQGRTKEEATTALSSVNATKIDE